MPVGLPLKSEGTVGTVPDVIWESGVIAFRSGRAELVLAFLTGCCGSGRGAKAKVTIVSFQNTAEPCVTDQFPNLQRILKQ